MSTSTIGRWLSGRTPRPRHRARTARALGVAAHELWPDADTPTPRDPEDEPGEIEAAYTRADDPDAPDWRELLDAAVDRIDLLDFTFQDIATVAVPLLAAKASAGCRIRVLVSDPDSVHLLSTEAESRDLTEPYELPELARDAERTLGTLQPLISADGVEVRTFIAARYNAILRFDDHMLVALHLWGTTPTDVPLLHLHRRGDDGLFDRFAGHYDAVWNHASAPVAADAERYPDPAQRPDRYQPDTTTTPAP